MSSVSSRCEASDVLKKSTVKKMNNFCGTFGCEHCGIKGEAKEKEVSFNRLA